MKKSKEKQVISPPIRNFVAKHSWKINKSQIIPNKKKEYKRPSKYDNFEGLFLLQEIKNEKECRYKS